MQVVSLMVKKESKKDRRRKRRHVITMHIIPLNQTSIKQDNRKRVPGLGRRIGKFLRRQSSRVRRKPSSIFRRFKGNSRSVEGTSHSFSTSSGSPSPKAPSSPRRAESMKDRVQKKVSISRNWRQPPPVSPLARSTSPVALSSVPTPSTSPHGSTQNLAITTPPSSPSRERHCFVEPSMLVHKKSISASELFPKKSNSPQTSPLLKRAVSPSPEQPFRVSKPKRSSTLERAVSPSPEQPFRVSKPKRSSTLERSTNIRARNKHTSEGDEGGTRPATMI